VIGSTDSTGEATATPSVHLVSTSRAGDAGYLAAADLARLAAGLEVDYRLVGGNAVTLLTVLHGVVDRVPARETADTDFGVEPEVVADPRLLPALTASGYTAVEGNRFVRTLHLPASGTAAAAAWELTVDVLTPSYRSTLVPNTSMGDLVVDQIPGLSLALSRPPSVLQLHVHLTSGHEVHTAVRLPDVVSALCLKAYAYTARRTDRDAVDCWRLLEAAAAVGVTGDSWPETVSAADAASTPRRAFGTAGSAALGQASGVRADQTRVRALVAHVVGPT